LNYCFRIAEKLLLSGLLISSSPKLLTMKTTNYFRFAITVLSIFFISSCKKTVENNQQSINAPNKAPIVAAGNDIKVVLPANEILLEGSFYDSENNVKTIEWTKLSGPDSFAIENKNDLKTRVSNLAEGVYQFELTVTDHLDAIGKDVVTVTVEARCHDRGGYQ
jgi:hypothetical protein